MSDIMSLSYFSPNQTRDYAVHNICCRPHSMSELCHSLYVRIMSLALYQNYGISFNCSAEANPSVTSYQLFENDTAILDTNTSGIWSRNMSTRGCSYTNVWPTTPMEQELVKILLFMCMVSDFFLSFILNFS